MILNADLTARSLASVGSGTLCRAFSLRTLLPIGFVTFALASLAFAEGADKPTVKVSAGAQGGFGRLTFDWSDDVKGQGQIADGSLTASTRSPMPRSTASR